MSPLLEKINNISREELVDHWQKHHGAPAPKGISQNLLKLSAAYHLQARKSSGQAVRFEKVLIRKSTTPKTTLEAGTLLVREWQGTSYKVEVLDKGFTMNGQSFRSLSQIARHITGTRWSGPRFFGLGGSA